VSISASEVPGVVATVTTSHSSTNVIIDWDEPDTGGAAITAYTIEIRKSDDTFAASASCPGTDPAVTQCTVPMSELTGTYNLSVGDLIVARVKATNANGAQSTWSTLNTSGATAQTIPDDPTSAPTEGSGSTGTALVIEWSDYATENTGGSPIT
jgi:hypothetical protein